LHVTKALHYFCIDCDR